MKSAIRSNWVTFQLLRIAADIRSPSGVSGGMRPLAGSMISEVCFKGRPHSNQWPEPIVPSASSRS